MPFLPPSSPDDPNFGHLLEPLEEQVLATGAFIREERISFQSKNIEVKGANDFVSYVDRMAEEQLAARCEQLLPGANLLLEEGGTTTTDSPWTWIIDPLDGTTNFIHNVPVFAISLGLQYQGETVLGLIYEVNNRELFRAIRGTGAYLNGEAIHSSPQQDFGQSLMATGFPFRAIRDVDAYLGLLREFMTNVRGIRRLGSAAVDLAFVACGRFEGFFESRLKPWDVAAGELLVREAGGRVTDYRGGTDHVHGGNIAASNGPLHADMLRLIQAYSDFQPPVQ